jgi:hypothetical protein
LKVIIFIFLLRMLTAGLVVAEENGALSSRTFTAAEAGFNLDYGNNQMVEHAIDERIIDRLGVVRSLRRWPVHSLQRIGRPGE